MGNKFTSINLSNNQQNKINQSYGTNTAQWAILNDKCEIEIISDLNSLATIHSIDLSKKQISRGDYTRIMYEGPKYTQLYDQKFSYYRGLCSNRIIAPFTCKHSSKPNASFIICEYYENTKNILISESLRNNLLNELQKLSKDKYIMYDIRRGNSDNFLHSKQKKFAITPIDTNTNCLIHELIDPNKHSFCINHNLWIPTVINIHPNNQKCDILSDILNVDRIKYKLLYDIIFNKLFMNIIKSSFERVLNYKLNNKQKIIMKSSKYILNKNHKIYKSNMHKEGMGENIIGVAIYYPKISEYILGNELELTVIDTKMNRKTIKFKMKEGSLIVFSNEVYHKLIEIKYKFDNHSNNDINAERIILSYFLVHPKQHIATTINKDNRFKMNMFCNTEYIILYWLRLLTIYKRHFNYNDFIKIITNYICGDEKFIDNKRQIFRQQRAIPIEIPQWNEWTFVAIL